MAIMENIKKIGEYWNKKNFENKMSRQVVKQTIVETNFYEKYSSFVSGLKTKLDAFLVVEGNSEVVFRPITPEHSKYFERVMQDTQFTALYNIKRTLGGEYSFKQKTFTDKAREMGFDDFT